MISYRKDLVNRTKSLGKEKNEWKLIKELQLVLPDSWITPNILKDMSLYLNTGSI